LKIGNEVLPKDFLKIVEIFSASIVSTFQGQSLQIFTAFTF